MLIFYKICYIQTIILKIIDMPKYGQYDYTLYNDNIL